LTGAKKVVSSLYDAVREGKDDEMLVNMRKKLVGVGGRLLPSDTKKMVEDEVVRLITRYQYAVNQYTNLPSLG